MYAGAYRYGFRPTEPRRQTPGHPRSGRGAGLAPEDCLVFLKDRFPAYITYERFEANQARLAANRARAESAGAVRDGQALLAGVVWCGRCGRRMYVRYGRADRRPSYICSTLRSDYGPAAVPVGHGGRGGVLGGRAGPGGVAAGGPGGEPRGGGRGRAAPAAGDPPLGAADRAGAVRGGPGRPAVPGVRAGEPAGGPDPGASLGGGAAGRSSNWRRNTTDSSGRSRELLDEADRERIRGLAGEVPALWHAATTTPADRRQVVRLLVDRVVLTVDPDDDRVAVRVEWAGGAVRERAIHRAVQGYKNQQSWPRLSTRLAELHGSGETPEAIAAALDREGFRPPKRASRFTAGMVRRLLHELGLRPRVSRSRRRPPRSCPRTNGGCTTWHGPWASRRTRCTDGGRRAGFGPGRSAAVADRGRCGRTSPNWTACGR